MDSQTWQYNSIFGGLNLLKTDSEKRILGKGERPPYPIIISNATFSDVFWNMNRADLGIFLFSIPIGFIGGKWAVKYTFSHDYLRKRIYNAVFSYVLVLGFSMAMNNSAYRLAGLVDNGLQWKKKSINYNKYDFTSEFEAKSIWNCLRVRY